MKTIYKPIFVFVCLLCTMQAQAQEMNVSGVVSSMDGEPLPGATVIVKGTTNGTTTSFDGDYTLTVSGPSSVLVFSYVGFVEKEVPIAGNTVINVSLDEDVSTLDEVVIVGYGTQTKTTVTAATSTIKGEELSTVPTTTVSSRLQGRLPGVSIRTVSGQPGNDLQIRVRGGSSINKSNDPLIIVDGLQRTLSDINPNDIESIDVLKDAAATAIYGSRASNGVVLITTKRGSSGKASLNLDISSGFQQFNRKYETLSAQEYLRWWRPRIALSRYGYSGGWIDGPQPTATGNDDTSTWTPRFLGSGEQIPENWDSMVDPLTGQTIIFEDNDLQDLLYRNALQTNYNVSAAGGSDKVRYATSVGFIDQDGVAIGSNYKRANARVNLDYNVTDNLKLSTNSDFSYSKSNRFRAEDDIFTRGTLNAPTIRRRFEDGTAGCGLNGTLANPQWVIETRDVKDQRLIGTFGLNALWDITDELSFSGNTSYQGVLSMYDYFEKAHQFSQLRTAQAERTLFSRSQTELLLKYKTSIAQKHNLDFWLGYTDLQLKTDAANLEANGGASDNIPTLNGAPNKTEASTSISEERLIGQFARLNYNYDLKYLFSATIRRDGSSKFGSGKRYGYFPSFSAGWVVSNEEFLASSNTLPFLKLRASYGITGNNDIGRYVAQGVYNAGYSYANNAATLATQMPNTALTWERTEQVDFGVDVGLFKGRKLELTADVYQRRTKDLLFTVELPRESGYNSVEQNVGVVEYKGVEVGITSHNFTSETFSWDTQFNFSYNINEVVKLPFRNGIQGNRINGTVLPDGSGFGGIAEGERLGVITGYKVDYLIDTPEQAANARYDESANGYDPNTGQLVGNGVKFAGDFEWQDRDGNGTITSLDQFELGYVEPTITGGLNNSFSFKNFSVDVFMDYALGHTILDAVESWMDGNKARRIATTTGVLDAWLQPGDAARTNQPRSDYHDQNHQNNLRDSDFYTYKGDYLCLRNVSLTYRFPTEFLDNKISRLDLSLTGNNLYYFTAYKGPNPERGGTITNNSGRYPVFRTFMLGVKIGL